MLTNFLSGYGNVVPKTTAGKIIFFPYCLVGIPVMMFFLSYIGKILSELCSRFVLLLSYLVNKTKADEVTHKELKTCFVTFILLWTWILLEAAQNNLRTDFPLSIVDGIYFYFVSFTTIGYGDITSPMKQPLFEFRLYIGLSLMSSNVNSFLEFYQKVKAIRRQEGGCCRSHTRQADIGEKDESLVITNRELDMEPGRYYTRKDQ